MRQRVPAGHEMTQTWYLRRRVPGSARIREVRRCCSSHVRFWPSADIAGGRGFGIFIGLGKGGFRAKAAIGAAAEPTAGSGYTLAC